MITKPLLPPKAGYVERVNTEGEHYYEPTAETAAKLAEEAAWRQVQEDSDAMAVDHEYRLTLLELGV